MTPLQISVMLACYTSTTPWRNMAFGVWSSEAACDARQLLQHEGMIGTDLRPTERGNAWVSAILSVPFPAREQMKQTMAHMAREEFA